MLLLAIVLASTVFVYAALRFNRHWIYRLFDKSLENPRDTLASHYETPRYVRHTASGALDTSVRWPGWDGWYVFVIPDRDSPGDIDMLRGSVMTGTYGLDGIDDREALDAAGLDGFAAVEYTNIVCPRHDRTQVHLNHRYLAKAASLQLATGELDVAVCGDATGAAANKGAAGDTGNGADKGTPRPSQIPLCGRIAGRWPNYKIAFSNPELGLEAELACTASQIVWWADVPGVFTYFTAFGQIQGTVRSRRKEGDRVVVTEHAIFGRGGIEHGYARKPFDFNRLWLPVRVCKRIMPDYRPIRFHYETLIGDDGMCGGFMRADGFGIPARNLGGIHTGGTYVPLQRVHVEYLTDPCPDWRTGGEQPIAFYKRWRVRAQTPLGPLVYEAERVRPGAPITGNMIYYHYTYRGEFRGQEISGSGYGEYLNI